MRLIKKILPFLITIFLSAGITYFLTNYQKPDFVKKTTKLNPTTKSKSFDWSINFIEPARILLDIEYDCEDSIQISDSYILQKRYPEGLEKIKRARNLCAKAEEQLKKISGGIEEEVLIFLENQAKYVEGMNDIISKKEAAIAGQDYDEWKKYISRFSIGNYQLEAIKAYRAIINKYGQ